MGKINIQRDFAKLGDIELFYLDTKTAGETILCLHGRWGRAETWIDFMHRYGAKYRIIAPDQRGHGLSGKPVSKYTAEEMAGDAVELLDYLKVESAIVFGHSMGGCVAGHLAALYANRVRAVAILDKSAAGPSGRNSLQLSKLEIIDPVTKDWPLPFESREEAIEIIRGAMDSELSFQYFMNSLTETRNGYEMLFSAQAMAANIAYYEDWYHLLPKIKCPTMLLRAKGNGAVKDEDFEKMEKAIPDCTAYEMSNSDHNVHLSDTSRFYAYCDEFFGRLGSHPES